MSHFSIVPIPSIEAGAVYVLLVSGDTNVLKQLQTRLAPLQWRFREARSGAEALDLLFSLPETEVMLLDPALPDLLPVELCDMVHHSFPQIEILILETDSGRVQTVDKSPSPFSARVTELLRHSSKIAGPDYPVHLDASQESSNVALSLPGIIGDCAAMQHVYNLTQMVAQRDTTVLITGESGTGKELIAQAVHKLSPRRQSPFVVVNCAAIPEALLEAELFGYAKGAFTGASQSRIGRVHAAQGGTLFLDEIGEMPLPLQGKILRFVEQGEVQRLGSNDNLRVDVRVVTATNAPLEDLVRAKHFREDLYFRLNVFPLRLPPLRERGHDITLLAQAFATRFAPGVPLTTEALQVLYTHQWPGNVRELRNVIERASILTGTSRELTQKCIML